MEENGRVHALDKGSATITVKTADGLYFDTCSVTVGYRFFQWLQALFQGRL